MTFERRTELDMPSVKEFLASAETTVDKGTVQFSLQSVETLRYHAGKMTMGEAYLAHKLETETYNREAILRRLEQRMKGRAAELVQMYFDKLNNVTNEE